MKAGHEFPQEWGTHMNESAPVTLLDEAHPLGSTMLQFERMSPEQFEQFCWWLIRKDHQLQGCQLLGKTGNQTQHGIDLFAYQRARPDDLVVFECKCWRNFTAPALLKAVDAFLDGPWAHVAKKFVIIIASRGVGNLAMSWVEAQRRLAQRGIDGELWTALHLTEKLQTAPDVLAKFFGEISLSQFASQWMRRVGFQELILRALEDSRPESSSLAREYLRQEGEDQSALVTRHISEIAGFIRRPYVEINALFPCGGQYQYPGSALISIKLPDTSGVAVSLSQKWLLKNFLGSSDAPWTTQCRPFFKGQFEKQQIVELGNSRFSLPSEALEELIRAADELSEQYIAALHRQESDWHAGNFPFVSWLGTRVVLCKLDSWVWSATLRFAKAHDVRNGSSPWHIFHEAHNRLMPCKAGGYRGFLWGAEIEDLCYENEVAILWDPSFFIKRTDEIGQWSCEEAFNWLTKELLPAALSWTLTKNYGGLQSWIHPIASRQSAREYARCWEEAGPYTDVRSVPLLDGDNHLRIGLVETVQRLQAFYHGGGYGCERAFFDVAECKELHLAMATLLKGGRGYLGYMMSKLDIDEPCSSHEQLAECIRNYVVGSEVSNDLYVLENVMRAMLEALADDDSWLDSASRKQVFSALKPFMAYYDQQCLIERHTRYI